MIVVTGSDGYIGSAVMEKLEARGIDIGVWDIRKPMLESYGICHVRCAFGCVG